MKCFRGTLEWSQWVALNFMNLRENRVENPEKTVRKEIREELEQMSDEELDVLELLCDLTLFHREFARAQAIVFNVSWGKDAIRTALKTS